MDERMRRVAPLTRPTQRENTGCFSRFPGHGNSVPSGPHSFFTALTALPKSRRFSRVIVHTTFPGEPEAALSKNRVPEVIRDKRNRRKVTGHTYQIKDHETMATPDDPTFDASEHMLHHTSAPGSQHSPVVCHGEALLNEKPIMFVIG